MSKSARQSQSLLSLALLSELRCLTFLAFHAPNFLGVGLRPLVRPPQNTERNMKSEYKILEMKNPLTDKVHSYTVAEVIDTENYRIIGWNPDTGSGEYSTKFEALIALKWYKVRTCFR